MPFEKGISGNPSGRKKGSPNKINTDVKTAISMILQKNFNRARVEKDLKALEPKQRLEFLLKLLEYLVPKVKSDAKGEDEQTPAERHRMLVKQFTEQMNMNLNIKRANND